MVWLLCYIIVGCTFSLSAVIAGYGKDWTEKERFYLVIGGAVSMPLIIAEHFVNKARNDNA